MKREPAFNIPPVIVAVLAVLALIHAARTYVLTGDQDVELLFAFAFIPARYDTSVVLGGALPNGSNHTALTPRWVQSAWISE